VTNLHAARVAAELRRRLGPDVEVETEDGRYGEFKVFVDGREVLSAGSLAFLGILPTVRAVRQVVEAHRPQSDGAAGASS
jgi:hypothetical protein